MRCGEAIKDVRSLFLWHLRGVDFGNELHLLELVRRKDPLHAWFHLSFELFAVLINLLDSNWHTVSHFWLLYLIVVAESVRYSWPKGALFGACPARFERSAR